MTRRIKNDTPEKAAARLAKFVARPPKRITEAAVTKRRSKAMRRYPSQWLRDLMAEQKARCFYCKGRMFSSTNPDEAGSQPTIDHVLALSQGGRNHRSNVVAACFRCNQEKGSVPAHEYLQLWAERHAERRRLASSAL